MRNNLKTVLFGDVDHNISLDMDKSSVYDSSVRKG